MVGVGIFALPGMAAAMTGPSVWLAYVFAALCVLPAALSKAELSTAMPTSGGTYIYLERTFGPLVGTASGLGLWLSLLLKGAFALVGFAAYLSVLVDFPIRIAAFALLIGVVVLNVLGVRTIGRLQKGVVLVVVVAVLVLVVGGSDTFQAKLMEPFYTEGMTGFVAATAFVFVSYSGVTKVAAIAEEVKNPSRNLPLGILLSLLIAAVIYAVVVYALVGNVSQHQLAHGGPGGGPDLAPIHSFAVNVWGPMAGNIAAVLAILAMVAMAVAGLMASSRFPFAMSRDNLVPSVFSRVNEQFMTPVPSIVLTGAVMGFAVLFLDVGQIAKLASSFKILVFIFVNGTVVVLRESASGWYQPKFRSPWYPWVQVAGIVLGIVLLVAMGLTGLFATVVIGGAGAVVYLFYGRRKTRRRGVVGRMGKRLDLLKKTAEEACELEDKLPSDAEVVVPLFGTERSPETLIDMADALTDSHKLEVLHVTSVPEQLLMSTELEEDSSTTALRRRIGAMSTEKGQDILFNTTLSRDVVQTVHSVAEGVHSEWVVMEAASRRQTGFAFQNPIGWLQDHLPCNLAVFKDAGIRYFRQILVYVKPGPHDSLVVQTADRLAKANGAELNFVCFLPYDMDKSKAKAQAAYVDQLRALCTVTTRSVVLEEEKLEQAVVKVAGAFDLLVMGGPPDRSFWNRFFGTVEDKITRGAACSVLWLKTSRQQGHDVSGLKTVNAEASFCLKDYLRDECVVARSDITRKEQLFRDFAERFEVLFPVSGAGAVEKALWLREEMQNTSVGMGVAMPHASVSEADSSVVGVFTVAIPMDYSAPDQQKVDVFFVTMGPPSDRQVHLQILAAVSKLSLETSFLVEARAASTREELLAALEKNLQELGLY
jgi:amino acid transporter/mannitol/fructose-specific phosphotransferase system IIA component (Ntr-type)/nucleotide-binding universal stress UspA family protein